MRDVLRRIALLVICYSRIHLLHRYCRNNRHKTGYCFTHDFKDSTSSESSLESNQLVRPVRDRGYTLNHAVGIGARGTRQ